MDGSGRRFPTAVVEVRDGQAEFELEGVFGVKVAARIAAHNFQLSVDGLDEVGGGKRFAHEVGILEEGEIVSPFLAEPRDPGGIVLGEAVTEFLEPLVADILTPGGLDGTEALLKLGGVGFGEMALSIALHVDGTELDISIGKEAFADLEKAGEIVLDEDHDASETALDQRAENPLPVFEILAAGFGNAGQDTLLAVAA